MAKENFLKDDNSIELQTTSKQQNLGNTNLQFYNMDSGTAVLNFIVTKNDRPFEIGPSNAKASIALKTSNYTVENGVFISDDLTFVDPINGRLSYTLPDSILSYTGSVHGQVYFAQNGSSNVIVQREFTFTVANDLISNIQATTKLTHIKTLNDITESIKDEVDLIKNSLSGGRDVVEGINNTVSDGMAQLEHKQNETVELITTIENEKSSIFAEKVDGFLSEVESKKNEIDTDITRLESEMSNANVLLTTDTKNWQMHSFTDSKGIVPELDNIKISQLLSETLSSKVYYLTNVLDAPSYIMIVNNEDGDSSVSEDIDANTYDDFYDETEENPNTITDSEGNLKSDAIVYGINGMLKIVLASNSGRATWEPDDSNEIYTCFYKDGLWYEWTKINSDFGKSYVLEQVNASLQSSKSYTDERLSAFSGQLHKLTNDTGEVVSINLDFGLTALAKLKSGFYYATKVPELPVTEKTSEGYLKVLYKDSLNAIIEYTPNNSNNVYNKNFVNGVWSPWNNVTSKKQGVLFSGAANGVGTSLNLTESIKNYNYVIISGTTGAGTWYENLLPQSHNGYIIKQIINLTDSNGSLGAAFELKLSIVDNTTLSIVNDVYYDYGTSTPSGMNANKFTINRIEGWK